MKQTIETIKRDWRAILVQSVISATVLLALATALAFGFGSVQRDQRVDQNTQTILDYMAKSAATRSHEHDVFLCLLTEPPANNGVWSQEQVDACQTQPSS